MAYFICPFIFLPIKYPLPPRPDRCEPNAGSHPVGMRLQQALWGTMACEAEQYQVVLSDDRISPLPFPANVTAGTWRPVLACG